MNPALVGNMFPVKITVKWDFGRMVKGNIRTEAALDDTAGDILESVCEFLKVDPREVCLVAGRYILSPEWTVEEMRIPNEAVLRLIPNPKWDGPIIFRKGDGGIRYQR